MAVGNYMLWVYLGHKLPLKNCGNIKKFNYQLDSWRTSMKFKVKINNCILNNLILQNILQDK